LRHDSYDSYTEHEVAIFVDASSTGGAGS
jgi:hypothetical protein